MPTYEFRCPDGHEFERFYRKISDAESEVLCPECGVVAARQLSAGAGLLFKGSGFYLTDYGKNAHRKAGPAASGGKNERKSEGSEGKSEGKSEGGSEGKSEKPESKSDGGSSGGESKSADTKPSGGSGKSTAPPKSGGNDDTG